MKNRKKHPTDRFGVTGSNLITDDRISFSTVAVDARKALKALRNYKCVHGKLWRNRKCKICMEPIR